MKKIEINILLFVLIEAFFLLYGIHTNLINILIGTILGLILTLVFSKLKKNTIMKYILLIITILLSFSVTIRISLFITHNLLKNYSVFLVIISLLIISFFLIKNNYHGFIKSVELIFYFFILIKIISLVLVIPNINLEYFNINLLEELNPNTNIIFIALIILYLHQSIYYLCDYILDKKIYIISIINPIIMKLLAITIIGRTLFNLYKYPYVNILKSIKYLNFFERMEGILSFEYLFSFITLLAFLLLIIKSIIKKTVNYL